jgi:hypothetical protein
MTTDANGNVVLDLEATAKNTFDVYKDANTAPYNFPAQMVVKDTWEWNQCIQRVGEV